MGQLTYRHSVLSAKVALTHLESGICLIRLSGELDNFAWRELSVFIEQNLNEDDKAVMVDFTELSFADSSSLKLVYGLAARFGIDKCTLFGVNANIRKLLELGPLGKKVPEIISAAEFGGRQGVGGQAS